MGSLCRNLLWPAILLVPVACDSQPTITPDIVAAQVAVGKAPEAMATGSREQRIGWKRA
jgi:hypothetical protein